MMDKSVRKISGIDDAIGRSLEEAGYLKAYQVFGEYLRLRKDREKFETWIKTKATNMNSSNRGKCFKCLDDWGKQHFP